ncbi:SsrA-binding protein [Candidatus Nomurabacteria bacterium RIFCSPHIGHO2_01_FULL_41_91]|uniref:SsrA-binding protein n=2 Tax=Candidatus Nomuraibacteriota TaxID=1752729 RepID=A0A1F6YB84_9BACT|nr:MAG: SsrA-binding protein [Candidatus Nomurabacteria bacterium RIFCSPHIGHO2_01_FULL_41_91]OGI80249.1 MAG: SsrA-binding protein [Candidatus Nomurabacteria bacterium RIFCSPHIGHO2_02_FULL_41_52]OGI85017.1 MAG: SsrA-binding protein [Candidatus Nomurabacteria bacterium RIFCSPHIGHO2_12_FULL_42_19]OGI94299.1 MAG: SsrA-binding protein [Candidatus Nomurabacteria bacterium RIFCSPLOWO2_01_FULL_41_52]OGI97947.1 MAG: SsrA-binding protein [Candidatus Nomurabacteria bacterium RIFCSPLOWO2_02_FULL_42_24]OGJ
MAHYAENRKARFNYEILEKYETGIELLGTEVKSVRGGQMSLEGAFVIIRGGEAFLINANIPPFQPKNAPKNYDPLRNRKLLLTKKEIAELAGSEKNKSLTIVPISVYNKNRKIKVEIALVKGKKKLDKRETIKKRETDRELRREYKGR